MVILTILAVSLAYSVTPQWSQIMKREREIQTVWVMKQYARAIQEFQRKRGTFPVSLEQLAEQTNPRILRQLYPNPLTGEIDWILVPAGAPTPALTAGGAPPGMAPPPQQPTPPPAGGMAGQTTGPFIGVRLPLSGQSFVELEGADQYEEWMYTVNELIRDQGGNPQFPSGTPSQNPQDPRLRQPRP